MKRFLIIFAILLLAGCINDGKNNNAEAKKEAGGEHSSSSLRIKPAELSKREQAIATQLGTNFQTIYTVNGNVKEGEVLKTSIIVYEHGKSARKLVSWSKPKEQNQQFARALHSFQVQMNETEALLTIGNPGSTARGNAGGYQGGSLFKHFDKEFTLRKGKPAYLGYLIGSNEETLSFRASGSPEDLPDSVKESDYAIVYKVELTEGS